MIAGKDRTALAVAVVFISPEFDYSGLDIKFRGQGDE